MKSIARDDNQVTLIYSSATRLGKRTRAHIDAINYADLQTIDVAKNPLTGTQWAEVAEDLNKSIKDLISFDDIEDGEAIKNADYDENDYIKILREQPEALSHPIAIRGSRIEQIINPTDIQQFMEVDSAGLDKKMMHEEPLINRQTKGEEYIPKNKKQ